PNYLTDINGTLYFTASDGTGGTGLWKSDGTTAGTVMVKDINPGGGSYLFGLTALNGTLLFAAFDGTQEGLWKSDGTAAGTTLVKHMPHIASGPYEFAAVNGTLFFAADDETHGMELWESDGTAAGTIMVQDLNQSGNDASSGYVYPYNNSY